MTYDHPLHKCQKNVNTNKTILIHEYKEMVAAMQLWLLGGLHAWRVHVVYAGNMEVEKCISS